MVDHVEFASASIVENFIGFWRATGFQRFGLMYGRYEPYSEVPLGVKAVVEAIYEPPQDCAPDAIQLHLPDPQQTSVDKVAGLLGLQLVGLIYLDLLDDGTGTGAVVCRRHAESYFLSSAECIFSAAFQERYPVMTRYASSRRFGSRFVTCVVSGNPDGGIETACYQVSNVGVAMARDGIIEATVEPSLMKVVETSDKQYVPEVFYKYKNGYGIMVKEAAKPTFPVEYLLVTLSHGFPQDPRPQFAPSRSFPTENRGLVFDQPQADLAAVHRHLSGGSNAVLADFHLAVFLAGSHVLDDADLARFAVAAAAGAEPAAAAELEACPGWQTLRALAREAAASTAAAGGASGSSSSSAAAAGGRPSARGPWTCRHCTFVNTSASTDACE
ncbi:nuclear protein localization protein 4, partial [Cladochytrium tenue]